MRETRVAKAARADPHHGKGVVSEPFKAHGIHRAARSTDPLGRRRGSDVPAAQQVAVAAADQIEDLVLAMALEQGAAGGVELEQQLALVGMAG